MDDPAMMQPHSVLKRYCRSRLEKLLNSLEQSDTISTELIWELLIELLSTVKVSVIQTERLSSYPTLVDLWGQRVQNLHLVSASITFAGWIFQVQLSSDTTLALKILSHDRVKRIRSHTTAAIEYLNSRPIPHGRRKFVTFALKWLVENEIDIEREARKLVEFHRIALDTPGVVAPALSQEWSSDNVIAMEWIDGDEISSWTNLDSDIKHQTGRRLLEFHHQAADTAGLIRYDTHPSNLKIMSDGNLAVLDYGSVMQETIPTMDTSLRHEIKQEMSVDPDPILIENEVVSLHSLPSTVYTWVNRFYVSLLKEGSIIDIKT